MNLSKILSVFGILAMLAVVNSEARQKKWQDEAQSRRADYMFMEAQRQLSMDNTDAYFELIKRAYQLNPSETSVGQDLGLYVILLSKGDSQKTAEGLELLSNHFEANPDDYYGAVLYGTISEKLGDNQRANGVWEKLHEIYPTKTDVSLRLADAYLARTADSISQSRALDLLDAVQVAEGPSLQLTARKVVSYMSRRDTVNAVNEARELIKNTPRSPESRVYTADLYKSLGLPDSALKYYNEACQVDPSS